MTTTHRNKFSDRIRPLLPVALLVMGIVAMWVASYGRTSQLSWRYPPLYRGDALYELGIIRAASLGYYVPFVSKMVPTLGAPNGANWNDYPQTEDCNFAVFGVLAAAFGLMPAANLALLIAYVLNGAAFYFACRLLHHPVLWSFVGAVIFAFSHYAYARGFSHLELSYYGHIPLALVLTWWLSSGAVRKFTDRRTLVIFAIVAWSGLQNAYYTYMIAQLIGLAVIANVIRHGQDRGRSRTALIGLASLCLLFLTFVLGNIDTLAHRWRYGNTVATLRQYGETELYALKPIELFLPYNIPSWPIMGRLRERYLHSASFLGEPWAPYLGVIGILALLALVITAAIRIVRKNRGSIRVPRGSWQLIWIFLFSVAGGINSMAAICGLALFRATNRYSIFILCIVILFFVRMISLVTRRWTPVGRLALASVILVVGFVDHDVHKDVTDLRAKVDSDRVFSANLERQLLPGSALFQLPIAEYPEQIPIGKMGDYEHLRPFFYTTSLKYSFGDDKGRNRTEWQREVEALQPKAAILALRQKGFAAIIIDRDGYTDGGTGLIDQFKAAGATLIAVAQAGDFVALKLP